MRSIQIDVHPFLFQFPSIFWWPVNSLELTAADIMGKLKLLKLEYQAGKFSCDYYANDQVIFQHSRVSFQYFQYPSLITLRNYGESLAGFSCRVCCCQDSFSSTMEKFGLVPLSSFLPMYYMTAQGFRGGCYQPKY